MAKSRRTKAKHSDFQKVKLRVGKKLPKAQNETVATFKSRSIQIKEQLKIKDTDQPTTKRKLNLQELFTQCLHYSPKVRHGAITGLRELLTNHKSVILENLAVILERVTSLLIDKDVAVRSALVRLLKLVFSQVSATQLTPFTAIVSAQLCCAMTHLAEEIQQDSLNVLDVCLDRAPDLVTSPRILSSFLQLISRPHGSAGRRSLVSNPASKLSATKWRTQVLQRLYRLLGALLSAHSTRRAIVTPVTATWKEDGKHGVMIPNSAGAHQRMGWRLRGQAHSQDTDLMRSVQQLKPLLQECQTDKQTNTLPDDCQRRVDKLIMELDKI